MKSTPGKRRSSVGTEKQAIYTSFLLIQRGIDFEFAFRLGGSLYSFQVDDKDFLSLKECMAEAERETQ